MPLTVSNYKGYPSISPDPTPGTAGAVINDAIKALIDTSVQVLGQFPAVNFTGAVVHFSRNDYQYFHCESSSTGMGGFFVAIAQSSDIDYFSPATGFPNFCSENGCWCNWDEETDRLYNAPFALCVYNASYITKLSINLLSFKLNPVAIQSFTSLTQLKLNEFTLTNDNLIISNLNDLTILNIHIKLSGSSTISINNLPALTTIYMSGDSYGGMIGLTDDNFTLDISSLPNIQYIYMPDVGSGLSQTWLDNFFIALANSVVANPRSGTVDIAGTNNSVSSASVNAREFLAGPASWSLSYNS